MKPVDKEHIEEALADVSSVSKKLSEQALGELLVLERFAVIHVARSEHPLYDLGLVVDNKVQLEAVEPSHRTLPLRRPSSHGLVHVCTLDVATDKRGGVNDGHAGTLAQGAGLEEQQQVQCYLRLTFYEAVVGDAVGELAAHVLTDVPEVERLQVPEVGGVKENEHGHNLGIRDTAFSVAAVLAWYVNQVFF